MDLAQYIAGGEPDETSAYIEWLRLRTRNLIVSSGLVRMSVATITDALLERETLTGPQIRGVVHDAIFAKASARYRVFGRPLDNG